MRLGRVSKDTLPPFSRISPPPHTHTPSARPALLRLCRAEWSMSLHLWRRLCCTARVAGRPTSISCDLATCAAHAALQDTNVHQVPSGALEIDAQHGVILHCLRRLCLHPPMSHYFSLLPWILLHTVAPSSKVRLPLRRISLSKASALASDQATVFCLLFRAPSQFRSHFLQGPRWP